MMKKYIPLLLMVCLLLTACGQKDDTTTEPEGNVFDGKIVQLNDSSVLLASDEDAVATLCVIDLTDLQLLDDKGKTIAAGDLSCGMVVSVYYDGLVQTIYPAQLSEPTTLMVRSTDDDMVGFYLTVLHDLYAVDPGLNGDITQLAFDLTEVHNLTDAEKEALLWLAGQEFELETYTGTFESLQADGIITGDINPRFSDGLLITFADEPLKNGRFTFQAEKWRSGTGAYLFVDCTASKKNGTWQYTIGAEAIA